MLLFSAVLALHVIHVVKGSSSGAPYETCNNGFTPKHTTNKASPYSVPFIIIANSSTYSANQPIAGESNDICINLFIDSHMGLYITEMYW